MRLMASQWHSKLTTARMNRTAFDREFIRIRHDERGGRRRAGSGRRAMRRRKLERMLQAQEFAEKWHKRSEKLRKCRGSEEKHLCQNIWALANAHIWHDSTSACSTHYPLPIPLLGGASPNERDNLTPSEGHRHTHIQKFLMKKSIDSEHFDDQKALCLLRHRAHSAAASEP